MNTALYVSAPAGGTVNLDFEYSPSQNTKRFQEFPNFFEQVLLNFILVCQNETKRVRGLYEVRENVRYGGVDDNQVLDIYYQGVERDTPLFVYLHGGYWQILDKSTSGPFIEPLVERGYRVIAVDYNNCPNVTLEQLTEQTLKLFEWVYDYANKTNTKEISFAGHSAGAHLLALLLKVSKLPNLPLAAQTRNLYFISGVYDLRELWQLESVNPKNIFSLDAQTAVALSPILWNLDKPVTEFVKENNIKVHLLVAENDSETFKEQTRVYSEKLKEAGLGEDNVKFKIFEKYDHFDIIEEVHVNGSAINRYLMDTL